MWVYLLIKKVFYIKEKRILTIYVLHALCLHAFRHPEHPSLSITMQPWTSIYPFKGAQFLPETLRSRLWWPIHQRPKWVMMSSPQAHLTDTFFCQLSREWRRKASNHLPIHCTVMASTQASSVPRVSDCPFHSLSSTEQYPQRCLSMAHFTNYCFHWTNWTPIVCFLRDDNL